MARVTVYKFKAWDQQRGEWVVARLKSTAARIEFLRRVEIIPGTEEEVDEADLDEEGRYDSDRKEGR